MCRSALAGMERVPLGREGPKVNRQAAELVASSPRG